MKYTLTDVGGSEYEVTQEVHDQYIENREESPGKILCIKGLVSLPLCSIRKIEPAREEIERILALKRREENSKELMNLYD